MRTLILLLAVMAAARAAQSATLTVNSTSDDLISDNFLTLREAVVLIDNNGIANTAASLNRVLTAGEQAQISGAFGINDKIMLPAGTFQLTIVGTGEGLTPARPKIGDLDLTVSGDTVQGAGMNSTIIQQTSTQDRVFDVNVDFIGDFVFTLDGGNMTVMNCVFGGTGATDKNTSSSSGGAIYFDPAFGGQVGRTESSNWWN